MRGAAGHMDRLQGIAVRHGLFVIEDAAQAMGGKYHGRRLGTIGDVGCYSMQTFKLLCVGEGGAVVARDPEVRRRMRAFHGETSASSTMLSLNYSMNELAAAIGCIQVGRLDAMLARMREIHERLSGVVETLSAQRGLSLRRQGDAVGTAAAGLIWFETHSGAAEETTMALRAMNVSCNRLYRPGVPDAH